MLKKSKQQGAINNINLSSPITLITFVFTLSALIFSYFSYIAMHASQKIERNHHQSYLLATQLHLSSDQLTLMARSYAVTGEEKYRQFYKDILAIREGRKFRPVFYNRVYWDLLLPQNGVPPFDDVKNDSFKDSMREFDFTDLELDLLIQTKKASSKLTKMELRAFELIEQGMREKGGYADSTLRRNAITLLYSKEYLDEKSHIKSLINTFFDLQEPRGLDLLAAKRFEHYIFTNVALFSFVAVILLLLYSLYMRKNQKELFVKTLRKEVANRTFELLEKTDQLKAVICEMTVTRKQLVEAEKMASLGSLVSGVAHEVNTPLGMGVMLASHLQDETTVLLKSIDGGSLKRSQLEHYCTECTESYKLLLANLDRAASLIRNFKQVAVDQCSEELRQFKVSEYITEVLSSLHPKLKKTQIKVDIKVTDDELMVKTYPGALAQIVTNLVLNAIIHAFDNGQKSGSILFDIKFQKSEVQLKVIDDGVGMNESVKDKVFDPFFTTQRGKGGSGLGLNIVYNLVRHQLLGTIECQSERGKGTTFTLLFPQEIEAKEKK